jgi:hypothetical protein
MEAAPRKFEFAFRREIEVGEVHSKERIFVFDVGAQEFEGPVFKSQDELGKMPGLLVIEAMRQVSRGEDVTVPVKDSTRIPILENARPAID